MNRTLQRVLIVLMFVVFAVVGGTARLPELGGAAEPDPSPTRTPIEDWEPDPENTPAPLFEPTYYSLHFVGDCTLASVPYFRGTANAYDTVVGDNYDYPFALTAEYFANDDLTFANLECALTTSGAAADKTFLFKAPQEYAKILSSGSVEVVSLANNHTFDYGQKGYDDTIAAVEAEGMDWIGRDENKIIELPGGLRIGFYCEFYDHLEAVKRKVTALKAQEPDFLIAVFHWGDEGSYQINSDQLAKAHAAVDCGADFVYGSHPHTIQPIEEYEGVPIYYSFGNWTFGGHTNPSDIDTFFLHMTLAQYPDGHVEIAGLENVPCAISGTTDRNNYQPVVLEEGSEAYDRVISKLDGTFTGQNLTINYGLRSDD